MMAGIIFFASLILLFQSRRGEEIGSKDRPVEVSLETISSTSILVRWKPPPNIPPGRLNEYRIRYKKKGGVTSQTVTVDGKRHAYQLNNLDKGSKYNVKLSALVGNHSLPFTSWVTTSTFNKDLIEVRVPGTPDSVQAQASQDEVFVSWKPPPDSLTIRVRGYVIGWGRGISDEHTQMQEGSSTSFKIPHLEPSSEYVISVRAFNEIGDGAPGYTTVRTLQETGGNKITVYPPIGLKTLIMSSTTAVLDWTDTTIDENQLDGRLYTVRYSSEGGKEMFQDSKKHQCIVEGLRPNTLYEFAVRTQIGKIKSEFSMAVRNKTTEAVPGSPPRDLTIVPSSEKDSSVIDLHWQPPEQPNGQVTGYVLFYTTDVTLYDREWIVEAILGDKLSTSLKGLKSDTMYYFKIQARNNKGYGPLSPYISFRTNPAQYTFLGASIYGSAVSTNTLYVVIIGISIITVILLILVSILLFKSRYNRSRTVVRKHKGYTPTATSPGGTGTKSKVNRGELKPPDLWINHDQVELKGLEKGRHGSDSGLAMNSLEINAYERERKVASSYSTSLYDDVNKSGSSPTDISLSMISGVSNTGGRKKIRAKGPAIVQAEPQPPPPPIHNQINLEPSTGLSRPVYPKPSYNAHRAHVTLDNDGSHHLYDPVSSPLLSMSSSMTSSMLVTNNVSYSIANNGLTSPNANTLGKGSQHPLKSFVPSGPSIQSNSQSKHVGAVKPHVITSPQKKAPIITTISKNPKGFTRISESLKKEDDALSTYSTEELNQEMANLEGLMKDLSAITASEFELSNL